MRTHSREQDASTVAWTDRLARRTRGRDGTIGAILAMANAPGIINFSGGFPAPQTFPKRQVAQETQRLFATEAEVAMQYSASAGLLTARESLVDRLADSQGHRPDLAEVMVTSGGIDALTLVSRAMLDPGDVAVLESPSYVGAVMGLRDQEARLVGVPMDDEGQDVDHLATLVDGGLRPTVVYVIPDHQNPTGRTMSLRRRTALVELCARVGALVVEDVAYRELSFGGDPLPSLWSLRPDVVVQIGTFSKTLFPGVRLGWAVGPREVVEQMVTAKQNSDQCAGALGQRLMEAAFRQGWYDDHVAAAAAFYAERGRLLTAALTTHLGGVATWTVPTGGFFSWLHVPGVDTVELARLAAERGVAFVPGGGFFPVGADHHHLRLSFSRVEPDDIDEGMARLRQVVDVLR